MIKTPKLQLLSGGAACGALALSVVHQLIPRNAMPDLTLTGALALGAAIGGAIGNRVGRLLDIVVEHRADSMEYEKVERDIRRGWISVQEAQERRRLIFQASNQRIRRRRGALLSKKQR